MYGKYCGGFFVFETEAINPDFQAVMRKVGGTSKSYGKTVLIKKRNLSENSDSESLCCNGTSTTNLLEIT